MGKERGGRRRARTQAAAAAPDRRPQATREMNDNHFSRRASSITAVASSLPPSVRPSVRPPSPVPSLRPRPSFRCARQRSCIGMRFIFGVRRVASFRLRLPAKQPASQAACLPASLPFDASSPHLLNLCFAAVFFLAEQPSLLRLSCLHRLMLGLAWVFPAIASCPNFPQILLAKNKRGNSLSDQPHRAPSIFRQNKL